MKRDDSVYLHHILDAISRIELYVQGLTEEAFSLNTLVQSGFRRNDEETFNEPFYEAIIYEME